MRSKKREKEIHLYVSGDLKNLIKKRAFAEELSMTEWVRKLIKKELGISNGIRR